MASESEASKTDIRIPRPVTIPDLVAVIVDLDLPRYSVLSLERDHPGISIWGDLDRLPDDMEANVTVHAGKVTDSERTPFGDWPPFIREVQWQSCRQSDLTFDAKLTVSGGFEQHARGDNVTLRGGSLRLEVETAVGKLNARYQSDGTVYLTVGFALPEESGDSDDIQEAFALPPEWTFEAEEVDEQQVRSLKRLIRGE